MPDNLRFFNNNTKKIAGDPVVSLLDYSLGIDRLPKSDVLKFCLRDASVVIRPSGTEPKLKVYISVTAENEKKAAETEAEIAEFMKFRIA